MTVSRVRNTCECFTIRWFIFYCNDGQIFVGDFLALHQSRAFSLHKFNHLFTILPKCCFCLNPGFNTDEIILIIYFLFASKTNALEYQQHQECWCQISHSVANFFAMMLLSLLKSLYSIEGQILWKAACSQTSNACTNCSQILIIFQSFILKFKSYSAGIQKIFFIDIPSIGELVYILMFTSFTFPSLLPCW